MSLVLDVIIMVMLTATIFYSARLSKKLTIIRSQKDELAANLVAFNNATDAALLAVEELQVKGEKICRQIEESIKKGQVTADDIEFLIDRAAKRVKEMDAMVQKSSPKPAVNNNTIGGYSEADLVKLLRQKQAQVAN